jgi:hypothetical protein
MPGDSRLGCRRDELAEVDLSMNASPRWTAVACRAALILSLIGSPNADAAGGKGGKGGGSKPHHATARPHASKPRNVRSGSSNPALARQRQMAQRYYTQLNRNRNYAYRPGVRTYRGSSYLNRNRYAVAHRYNRAIVNRLRATHTMLARLDHDYGGHRVRAMHAISTAVRSLTHTSLRSYARRGATGLASTNGQANRRGQRLPQATSDAQIRRAMHSLQTVEIQLAQHSGSPNQIRARGSVNRAMRELNVALTVR